MPLKDRALRLKIFTVPVLIGLALLGTAVQAAPSAEEFYEICRSGTVEELSAALAAGAEVNAADQSGLTPLMLVVSDGGRADAKASVLLQAGADPNLSDRSGRTALHWAVGAGQVKLARRLLAAGAEVNAFDEDGFSPLLYAARKMMSGTEATRKAMLSLLLASGADTRPGVIKESGLPSSPPLMAAAFHCGPEIVELLLAAGCPVDQASHTGYTPLMAAAEFNGRPDTVAALLAAGADPKLADMWGATALDKTADNETPAAGEIRRLLEAAEKEKQGPEPG